MNLATQIASHLTVNNRIETNDRIKRPAPFSNVQ